MHSQPTQYKVDLFPGKFILGNTTSRQVQGDPLSKGDNNGTNNDCDVNAQATRTVPFNKRPGEDAMYMGARLSEYQNITQEDFNPYNCKKRKKH